MTHLLHWLGRLVGAFFLLWTVLAAGTLWNILLGGGNIESVFSLGALIVLVSGSLTAWFLAWLWYRQPLEERRHVQRVLLAIVAGILVALAVGEWRNHNPTTSQVLRYVLPR